jgi:glucuronate isomerase
LADHALDHFAHAPTGETQTAELWERRLDSSSPLGAEEVIRLKSGLLGWLGREYARRNWILQLHLGAQRTTSSRLLRLAGPAGGFAGMGDPTGVGALCSLLDELEQAGALPRTILYSLNPALQAPLATLTGSFSEDGVAGKLQLGPAWWYNDHAAGIRGHLETLSSHGLLSTFIGMTTDSRSLLSMARHEYFRRILCEWVGGKVEAGFLPDDPSLLEPLLTGICRDNAARWMSPKQPTTPASA